MDEQNSTTSSDTCGYSESYWIACDLITRITYAYLPPICFVFGMAGHILTIMAFVHDKDPEKAYSYQILSASTKICEILAINMFILFFFHLADQDWSGQGKGNGPRWFVSNYGLMRFTAHFLPWLAVAFVSVPILAAAATAIDRVFAMYAPMRYRLKRHSMHVAVANVACFLIPLAIEVRSALLFTVAPSGGAYKIQYSAFSTSTISTTLGHLASSERTIGQLILIGSSAVMVYLFRQRNLKVKTMVIRDEKHEHERKRSERILFLMTLFQSVATVLPGLLITVWAIGVFFSDAFAPCVAPMLSPLTDLIVQVINAVDFYVIFAVNKHFRRLVRRALRRT